MRIFAIIQRLLQGLAIIGLLLAPSAGFALNMMDRAAAMAASDDTPCCPNPASGDCHKCALTARCMAKCQQSIADLPLFAPISKPSSTTTVLDFETVGGGVVHSPPLRPPQS